MTEPGRLLISLRSQKGSSECNAGGRVEAGNSRGKAMGESRRKD